MYAYMKSARQYGILEKRKIEKIVQCKYTGSISYKQNEFTTAITIESYKQK